MPPSFPHYDAGSVIKLFDLAFPPRTLTSVIGGNKNDKNIGTLPADAVVLEEPFLRLRGACISYISRYVTPAIANFNTFN